MSGYEDTMPAPPPLPPDVEAKTPFWYGPAGAQAEYWRKRALAAEARILRLVEELSAARGRPHL